MKKSLKIFVIAIFLAILIIGLAMLRLWISSLRSPPLMSFDFLNGRAMVARVESDPRKSPFASIHQYHSWIQFYSFKADFSDVCKVADAELLALGFKTHTISVERRRFRVYTLNKATSSKNAIIFDKQRFVGSPNVQLLRPSVADGWVTVKIERGRIPLWPPRYLLYRLKKHLQVAGWEKSKKSF